MKWAGQEPAWLNLRWLAAQPSLPVTALAVVAFLLPMIAASGLMPTGDGALHADLASQIAASGSLATEPASHYPPLFHAVGSIFHSLAEGSGLRFMSALALGITSVMTYLVARQLGFKAPQALAAQALVSFSPVMLWYAGLILMETTLVATVMVTILLTLRFTDQPTLKRGVALVAALTAMLLIKQTAAPVAIAVVAYIAIFPGAGWKRGALVGSATLLLIALPYWQVYEKTGALIDPGQPSLSDISASSETFPGSLITGGWVERQPDWSLNLERDVDSSALHQQGIGRHLERHVWAGNLFAWTNFTWLHSLYPASFSGYDHGQVWPTTVFATAGLFLGLVAMPSRIRRHPEWILLCMVLVISYLAMYFGSDTKRLYMFVTAISAFIVVLGYVSAWKWTVQRSSKRDWLNRQSFAISAAVATVLLLAAIPQIQAQFTALDEREFTQGGGFPSVGGVESIVEIGQWLQANTAPDEGFVAASVYEWEFYSGRQDLWDEGLDYRLYFLTPELIREHLHAAGAKYVVIRANQIVPDDGWDHLEMVPEQFVTAIESMFPMVKESLSADIRVYEVTA